MLERTKNRREDLYRNYEMALANQKLPINLNQLLNQNIDNHFEVYPDW